MRDVFSYMVSIVDYNSPLDNKISSRDGFALLEMIFVVSILSIITISFSRFFHHSRQYAQIMCTKRNLCEVAKALDFCMNVYNDVPPVGAFSAAKSTQQGVYALGGAVGAVPYLQLSLPERSILDGNGDEIVYVCGITEHVNMISENGSLYAEPAAYVIDTASACNIYRDNGSLYVKVGPYTHWKAKNYLSFQEAI